MLISIIFAYYNRRSLLINTLNSIINTTYNSTLELIIINDGSSVDQGIDDLPGMFPQLNIRIFNIKPTFKWWINPCIPNNLGIYLSKGEVIILQNPECLHTGNIIQYVEDHIVDNKYLVFGCYAVDYNKTAEITNMYITVEKPDIFKAIHPLMNVPVGQAIGGNKWYQHSKYSPSAFNFCAAITRKDLLDLGGFDELYMVGIAKDDKEFILRVKRKGMTICYVDDPFVIHQHHLGTDYSNKELVKRNTLLYNVLLENNVYKVNNQLTEIICNKLGF